ncbi:MAG: YaiI/YqxD family protein [Gammaproteobacteria bacterium]|nr:YaiI/YqxD family protein [Gammaproteobacteria bacterium]
MSIWLDADACPKPVKELCFKFAIRKKISVILVANSYIHYPNSHYIQAIQVHSGINSADNYIVTNIAQGDLVVTADIELASHVLNRKAEAISPRGEVFHLDTIASRLSAVQVHATLRDLGQFSTQAAYSDKEKQSFANALDRYLARKKN